MSAFPWQRILWAAAIGAVVALVLLIVGPAIASAGIPILSPIAASLVTYAVAIGVLVAIIRFARG